jgi:hypothetical protein
MLGVTYRDVDAVAMVVLHCRTTIPARCAMLGPRLSFLRFFVDDDMRSDRGKGSAVEIEIAEELGVGGKLWVDAGLAKEV